MVFPVRLRKSQPKFATYVERLLQVITIRKDIPEIRLVLIIGVESIKALERKTTKTTAGL
jgi:hypothetical protein